MTYEKAIAALADPTRRLVMDVLRGGPLSVAALADQVPVSRPAVSQHLRVLTEAGLLNVSKEGTRRLYSINPGGADEMRRYLDTLWDDALAAYTRAAVAQAKGQGPDDTDP